MKNYQDLIGQFGTKTGKSNDSDLIHASLAGYPDRLEELKGAVDSMLSQVDTLHVFLNEFDAIPGFLDQDKVFITRSQDFGKLGECGKYYWTDDLNGFLFICSDRLVYPPDYVITMISKIEQLQRKMVVAAGGFNLRLPFIDFSLSAGYLCETDKSDTDTRVSVISDSSVAYHSSTLHVSRHYFYQPELSNLWFSIIGLEQNVPFLAVAHEKDWIKPSVSRADLINVNNGRPDYRSFLIRAYFLPDGVEKSRTHAHNINDYFDRIYVMNLDRRPDRWEKIMKISQDNQLNLNRFPSVDGYKEPVKTDWDSYFNSPPQLLPDGIEPLVDFTDKFLKYFHYVARVHFMESKLGRKAVQSPGAWGYALSYIEILKDAIEKGYHRILIFDDDIMLHKSFNHEFKKHVENLPEDWKMIMLGAMQHQWEPWTTPETVMFYHCHGSSVASHAVGIDRKMFLPLLHYALKLDLPIDEGAMFHIQNVYSRQCFIFTPNLAIQEMEESDISSSAMKPEDMDRWMKLFRWNPDDYERSSKQG